MSLTEEDYLNSIKELKESSKNPGAIRNMQKLKNS